VVGVRKSTKYRRPTKEFEKFTKHQESVTWMESTREEHMKISLRPIVRRKKID